MNYSTIDMITALADCGDECFESPVSAPLAQSVPCKTEAGGLYLPCALNGSVNQPATRPRSNTCPTNWSIERYAPALSSQAVAAANAILID